MIVNKESLQGIQTSFRTIFMQTFEKAAPMDLTGVVDDFPMSTGRLELAWCAVLGKMREWLGDRQARDIVAKNYAVVARHFEHTVEVDRDDIEDDNMGQYGPQIRKITIRGARFPDRMVADAITANATCWDGQPLVDDSHPAFGPYAAFDNKITTALSADSTGYAAVITALGMMSGFKDAEGDNLGLSGKALVVPNELQYVARALINSPFKIGTTSDFNELAHLKLIVLPLSDATNWYVVDTDAEVAPFIRGRRKELEFNAVDDPNDSRVFSSRKFQYGIDGRWEVVPGFPQAIVGSIQ
jgi:phage major head subunit gpT-like protein